MPTEQPGQSADQPPKESDDKKARKSYLVIGIMFLAVGIGLSFGDSSAWVVFLVLGVTFTAMSGTKQFGRKTRPRDKPGNTP